MKFFATFALLILTIATVRAVDLAAQVREEINLARTAPRQYAQIVAVRSAGQRRLGSRGAVEEAVRFLQKVSPLPALARCPGLDGAALLHVLDQGPAGARGHRGTDGSSPWKRMARFGQWSGRAAENIAYGQRDARDIVVALIVDDGVRDRGHRQNIFGREFRLAGIACGPHAAYGRMCVMDFAAEFTEDDGKVAARE